MKIRTQLIAGFVVFALLLIIISSLVVSTNQQADELVQKEDTAHSIALEVGELGYLSNDYILYREPQQAERWNAKFDSISRDVAGFSAQSPEQMAIVNNLESNLRNTKSVFDDIVASQARPGTGADMGFVQLSWSRMAVQNQGMIFDAGRLAHLLSDEVNGLRQTRTVLIFALMGTFTAFLLTSYFLFYRRTLKSISILAEGTRIIGSGNLNHTIEEGKDDEISELSRSFNSMTSSLRKVTASKGDLEHEVYERKRAEEDLARKNNELSAINEELTATQEELRQNLDELVRTSENLQRSEERLSALYMSMTEGLAIHEIVYNTTGNASDYRITEVNPAFSMITGISRERAEGALASELYGTGEAPYLDVYTQVAETGTPREFETLFDPMEKSFHISVFSPARGKFATVFSDITERKRAEEALRSARDELGVRVQERTMKLNQAMEAIALERHRLYDVLETLPVYVCLLDKNYRMPFANKYFRETFGYSDRQCCHDFLFNLDAPCDSCETYTVMKTKAPHHWYWTGPNNRNYDIYDFPFYDADGSLLILEMGIDITEQKKAEAALTKARDDLEVRVGERTAELACKNTELFTANEQLSRINEELTATQEELRQNYDELSETSRSLQETSQYLESLINYSNAPIIVWDPTFRISRFNQAFARLTGRSSESVIGKPLDILFSPQTRDASMGLIHRAMTGERWEVVEIPIMGADGTDRSVLWNSAPIYGNDGKTIISIIAQGLDITDRKLGEEALKEYADNLMRSNRELEQFAYVASHDLREPLRMVTSFSQLLEERYKGRLDPDADEFIHYIVEGGQRMDALVNDLLEFSRITSRANAFEPTDMNAVVGDTLRNLSVAIQESGVEIQSDVLPTVSVDRSQMVQVFQNLIANAIKFRGKNHPKICIGATRQNDEWVFSVSDNGIGIDPAYWDKIFEIFKRLHTREEYPGTGIGLAICRRIIERHGGRIWVESVEGKGSTFFFSLPALDK